MKENKKSSIWSGMIFAYALVAVLLLTASSGCIGSQNQPATTIKSAQQNPTGTSIQATTSVTVESEPQADFSQVSISLAGCDIDDYNNTLVAGYVKNNGVKMMDSVPIVAQLMTQDGVVVSGGEKTTVLTNLKPGETQKFSVVYTNQPEWKKCRASVNGDWPT